MKFKKTCAQVTCFRITCHKELMNVGITALQISLDLCIPEKELAKTRSQISFIYFQSHS
jgi:hypothetical protein